MVPALVRKARAMAEAARFRHPSTDDVGRLLQVLAASIRAGRVGEIGTGYGVGASWIAAGLRPGVPFFTVELDAVRAAAAASLLAAYPDVTVIRGDWHELLPHGPFALLFPDGAQAKLREPETVLSAVEPGGLIVLDDLTPGEPVEGDAQREFWLRSPTVVATELQVGPRESIILAVKR